MGKMIQVRNVPEKIHRRLKSRAAEAGMSLSEYLLRELRRVAERPSPEEIADRLEKLPRIDLGASAADLIREGREERDEQVWRATFGR